MFTTTQGLDFFVGLLNYIKDPIIITFVVIFLMRHYIKKTDTDSVAIYSKIGRLETNISKLATDIKLTQDKIDLTLAKHAQNLEDIAIIKNSLFSDLSKKRVR